MNNAQHKHFFQAVRWNAAESLLYQGILLGHQLLLFAVVDTQLYGLIGLIFSLLYLIVSLTNFGLDASMAQFFAHHDLTQNNIRSFLGPHIIIEIITLLFFGLLFIVATPFLSRMLPWLPQQLFLIVIVSCLIIFEGIKKTARTLLQLAFLNHQTASLEIASVALYATIVWTWYALGNPIDLFTIFFPMLITTTINTLLHCWFVYLWYYSLSTEANGTQKTASQSRIIKNRCFNYLHQLSHIIFSANFLVPLFAHSLGLETTGIIKVFTHTAYAITTLFNKMFGMTTEALFAQVIQQGNEKMNDVFGMVTKTIHQALYGLLIFFIINHTLFIKKFQTTQSLWFFLLFFLVLSISEYFFLAYEKLFITHEQTHMLLVFNGATIILSLLTLSQSGSLGAPLTLILLILIRILIFMSIKKRSMALWRVTSQWHHMDLHYFVAATSLSLLFCAIFNFF